MASSTVLPPVFHPEQRLKLSTVQVLTGLGKTKLYYLIKAGKFPQPERDGARCSRWRAGDVLDHLAARRVAQPGAQEAA